MAAVFLSDIHLQPHGDPKTLRLAKFIDSLDATVTELFLLGDIFDFWMGGNAIFVERYRPLVDALKRLRVRGVAFYFFEGNHDIHVDRYFSDQLGAKVFVRPQTVSLYGKTIRIEHGDFFNPDDTNYLALRGFLRSAPIKWLSNIVPGAVVSSIGDWSSKQSHKRTSVHGRKPEVVEDIKRRTRLYIETVARQEKFDLMIMGHTHVREDYEVSIEGRPVRFINLGSWFEPEPKALFVGSENIGFRDIP